MSPPTVAAPASGPANVAPPPPKPIAVVNVVAQPEQRAAANPQTLNTETSIVDLLKMPEIDSSFGARKELAAELGCPANLIGDLAQMSRWLHKMVLKKIGDNSGNIPGELLGRGLCSEERNMDIRGEMSGIQSVQQGRPQGFLDAPWRDVLPARAP